MGAIFVQRDSVVVRIRWIKRSRHRLLNSGYRIECRVCNRQAPGGRRIQLQDIDVVKLPTVEKDSISSADNEIGSDVVGEAEARRKIFVTNGPDIVQSHARSWSECRYWCTEIERSGDIVYVNRRSEEIVTQAKIQCEIGAHLPVILHVFRRTPLARLGDRDTFR